MSLHKLYVALSHVRMGKHLAIFPARSSELKYLTKLKYFDKLLAWFPNYNADGKWEADVRIFLARMWMPH